MSLLEDYRKLGIHPSATMHDIRHAYLSMCRKFHPDRNPSSEAHQQFLQIHQAYERLKGCHTSPSSSSSSPTNSCDDVNKKTVEPLINPFSYFALVQEVEIQSSMIDQYIIVNVVRYRWSNNQFGVHEKTFLLPCMWSELIYKHEGDQWLPFLPPNHLIFKFRLKD